MGVAKEEEYFPRGRSFSKKPALRKSKDSLFRTHKKTKKKSKKNTFLVKKPVNKNQSKKLQPLLETHHVKSLTYQELEEGMIVVGRIREIWQYHMFVCLPGRLSGKVPVAAISTPYSTALTKLEGSGSTDQNCPSPSDLFRVGQSVVCCVMEVSKTGSVLAVSLSLDPAMVNKSRGHNSLRAGHTLVAAVSSSEDHGYTLYTGIPQLTAFLRHALADNYVKQVNQGRPLAIGEIVRCLVTKCITSASSTRIDITIDPKVLTRGVLSDINFQTLQPFSTVHCSVDQVMQNGLVVNLGRRGGKGYIEANQLTNCWSAPKHYSAQDELTASVLYSLPYTNFQTSAKPVYLTLKNLIEDVKPCLEIGVVIQGKVTRSGVKGLTLCLGGRKDNKTGNKGFVSIRRLGQNIEKGEVSSKFPKGTLVNARILAFDYMEQLYNCSLESSKINLPCVNVNQLKVGDRVTCRVAEVEEAGLKLVMGSIRMYVFKDHSADIPYSNLFAHFIIGDEVDARVLKINPETRFITATMKETLIRSPALSSYEDAHVGDGYWGTLVHVSHTSLHVSFYNDVMGRVTVKDAQQDSFNQGLLVKCYVTYVNAPDTKLWLSLTPPQKPHIPNLTVGELYYLVVSKVTPKYYLVTACDYDGVEGSVPKSHLNDNIMHKEGDFFKAWLYSKKQGKNLFSPNPAIQGFFKTIDEVKSTCLLTCCVSRVAGERLTVETNLPGFRFVEIPKSKWDNGQSMDPYQILQCYVEHIDTENKSLVLSCKKPQVPYKDLTAKTTKKGKSNKIKEKIIQRLDESNNSDSEIKSRKRSNSNLDKDFDILNSDVDEPELPTKKMKNQLNELEQTKPDSEIKSRKLSNSNPLNSDLDKSEITTTKIKRKLQELDYLKSQSNETTCSDLPHKKLSVINTPLKVRKQNKSGHTNNTTSSDPGETKLSKKKLKKQEQLQKSSSVVTNEHIIVTSLGKAVSGDKPKSNDEEPISQNENKIINKKKRANSLSDSPSSDNLIKEPKKQKGNYTEEPKKVSLSETVYQCKNLSNHEQPVSDNKNKIMNKKERANGLSNSSSTNNFVKESNKQKIKCTKNLKKPTLKETGFQWDIKLEDLNKPVEEPVDEEDEEVDDATKGKKKKTAAERRRAAKEEEVRLRRVEQLLLDSESNPQSVDQFDRAVLAKPDDADLWIKYMSHHLQATEIEKARSVARRALQTINQRHETERLNVWIALLNLENLFGTQESLKDTLNEALRTNDEFTVYCKMLKIYAEANKTPEVDHLVNLMVRKFRDSTECWHQCLTALMKSGAADRARVLLQRAITALSAKEHVNLLCKFALLENQHGFSDQAQTLFEHILTSYPKRTDVWNVYVDMLVKSNKVDVARQILERATRQKLPSRKMKMLFSKWISFEEKHGSPERVEDVRNKAVEYVNNVTMKLE